MSLSTLFPIKFWKFLAISFGWDSYDPKLLKAIEVTFQSMWINGMS